MTMLTSLLPSVVTLPTWSGGFAVLLAKATIILVAALAITRQMHRASAGARHLVWLVTLGTLLFVPALTAWAPLAIRILPARAAPTDAALSQTQSAPSQNSPATTTASDPMATASAGVYGSASAPATNRMRDVIESVSPAWPMWLGLLIWGAVAIGITGALATSAVAVRRIVRPHHHSTPPPGARRCPRSLTRLGLGTPPRLLVSPDIKMPFACGVITPAIVLPAECHGWSLDRRQSVLLHELAHVRRGDLVGHMLGRLVCALYWFHPLVWMAAKRLRSESERACDDLAVSCGTRATDYAEHLLDIVTSVRTTGTPVVALAMARRKEFEGRLLAILDPDLRHSTPFGCQSAALITVLALSASLVAAAAPVPRVIAAQSAAVTKVVPTRSAPAPLANAPLASAPLASAPIAQETHTRDVAPTTTPRPISPAPVAALRATVTPAPIANLEAKAARADLSNVTANPGAPAAQANAATLAGGQHSAPDDRVTLLAKVLRSDSSAHLRRIAAWGLREAF